MSFQRIPTSRQTLASTLSMPLPDLIRRLKDAGREQEALETIDVWLEKNLPDMLRRRLLLEQARLRTLSEDYPYDREQALEELQKTYPMIGSDDFDRLEREGKIDYLFREGEKRYHVRFAATMNKDSLIRKAYGLSVQAENPYLDDMMHALKERGSLSMRFTLNASVMPNRDTFVPGDYRAWLPYPLSLAQQSDVSLLGGDPTFIAPDDAPARCAYFERHLESPETFELTYRFTSTIHYADPLHAPAPETPLYPNQPAVCEDDLSEDHVHIRFTPYLTALAASLTRGALTDAEKAWAIYIFVTTRISYSFVRDYLLLDDIAEYCALNLRGDCGLQAILFISLCRIAGIPARWQSSLCINADRSVGCHDWAQFYLPGWGWLFADCSYGGSAFRAGSQERHAFYFGNLDPARMAANRVFMADLSPDTLQIRRDPYDSQMGEMERIGSDGALRPSDYLRSVRCLSAETLNRDGGD